MMKIKDIVKVHIIESPSEADIQANRNEGSALSEMLTLTEIQNELYKVGSLEMLTGALETIACETKQNRKELGQVILHFSMHGTKNGLTLTNGTVLNWEEFHGVIKTFNDSIGYIELPGMGKFSCTSLHFSVCSGYYAKAIEAYSEVPSFTCLVGPTESIDWSSSLVAYSVYYHNTLHRKIGTKDSIDNMNNLIGQDVFQATMCEGMELR